MRMTRLLGLPPVLSPHTRLVVLGSFPSARSLAAQQYYAHPRNQFWPLVSALFGQDLAALPYADRIDFIREHGLGLWDVYAACRREGSLDSAIEAAEPNDLAALPRLAPALQGIAHNGSESARALKVTGALGLPVWRLPSSSPAHAAWSFERKLQAWRAVFNAAGLPAAAGSAAVTMPR
jgi:hypoxanthine-DNA glycosylase